MQETHGFRCRRHIRRPRTSRKNFPGYPHNTSGNDGIVLALNAPDAKGTPQTSETAAVPEQMTFGAWLWDYLYNGASITVGVGTRQAELKVTEKSSGRYGKIAQRDEEAYFFKLQHPAVVHRRLAFRLYLYIELYDL